MSSKQPPSTPPPAHTPDMSFAALPSNMASFQQKINETIFNGLIEFDKYCEKLLPYGTEIGAGLFVVAVFVWFVVLKNDLPWAGECSLCSCCCCSVVANGPLPPSLPSSRFSSFLSFRCTPPPLAPPIILGVRSFPNSSLSSPSHSLVPGKRCPGRPTIHDPRRNSGCWRRRQTLARRY